MATSANDKQVAENARHSTMEMNALIGEQVIQLLGQPGDLHSVQVRKLWDDHYRVNILLGSDAASMKIAECFFLVTDTSGNILESSPTIAKRY